MVAPQTRYLSLFPRALIVDTATCVSLSEQNPPPLRGETLDEDLPYNVSRTVFVKRSERNRRKNNWYTDLKQVFRQGRSVVRYSTNKTKAILFSGKLLEKQTLRECFRMVSTTTRRIILPPSGKGCTTIPLLAAASQQVGRDQHCQVL